MEEGGNERAKRSVVKARGGARWNTKAVMTSPMVPRVPRDESRERECAAMEVVEVLLGTWRESGECDGVEDGMDVDEDEEGNWDGKKSKRTRGGRAARHAARPAAVKRRERSKRKRKQQRVNSSERKQQRHQQEQENQAAAMSRERITRDAIYDDDGGDERIQENSSSARRGCGWRKPAGVVFGLNEVMKRSERGELGLLVAFKASVPRVALTHVLAVCYVRRVALVLAPGTAPHPRLIPPGVRHLLAFGLTRTALPLLPPNTLALISHAQLPLNFHWLPQHSPSLPPLPPHGNEQQKQNE